jgi:5-methylcytosine-specific restriction endonuclease McrA
MAESGPQSRAVPRTHRAQPGDRIPISVRLNQKKYGVVAVHFFDLEAAGLADGDLVTLDIGGAQVGGMVWTDKGGPWLSKGPTDWSGRRRTDALLAVGITHPHRADAVLTSIDVVADPTADHEELHARASRLMQLPIRGSEAIGNAVPSRVEVRMMRFERDPRVVAAARRRADGRCESCGCTAPFLDDEGQPFLEVHHVVPLAEGGPDTLANAVALCPNCHRFLHYGPAHARATARECLSLQAKTGGSVSTDR